jgi:hypothetical protein
LFGKVFGNEGARPNLTLQVSFGMELVEGLDDSIPRDPE